MGHQFARLEMDLPRTIDFFDDRLVAENVLGHVGRQTLNPFELGVDRHSARANEVRLSGAGRAPEHEVWLSQRLGLTQLVRVRQKREERPGENPRRVVETVQPLGRLVLEALDDLLRMVKINPWLRFDGHASLLIPDGT